MQERLQTCENAIGSASINSLTHAQLTAAELEGRLFIADCTTASGLQRSESGQLHLAISPSLEEHVLKRFQGTVGNSPACFTQNNAATQAVACDEVWLAAGRTMDIASDPVLKNLLQSHPPQVSSCHTFLELPTSLY